MAACADHGVKRKLSESDTPDSQSADCKASGDNTTVYSKGQAVYVRDTEQVWVPAVVTSVNMGRNTLSAKLQGTDQEVSCSTEDVLLRSDKPLDASTNLTQVTPVHEATVLCCLHERFLQNQYYTNAGTTVVAVNPFRDVSHLYSREQIQAYHDKTKVTCHDLPPHIYQIAEAASSSLVRGLGQGNQSIVVSGESGAGKTVSAKHLLKYLTVVSNPQQNTDHPFRNLHTGDKIEQRILDCNPILEAFGNAATPRNTNSSRVGHIQGGAIQTYLLEKTRVVHQGHGENNFHIFYQMTGMSGEREYPPWLQEMKREMDGTSFACVPYNQDCRERGDIQDTLDAMTDIGLKQEMQRAVFQVLLAVLHLGNLRFMQVTDDASDLDCSLDASFGSQGSDDSLVEVSVTEKALERSCQLLGLEPSQLRQTLLHRSIQPGGRNRQSIFVKPIGIREAQSRRDCLAMLLYSRLFEWLVKFINHQIHSEKFDNTIGLLDIYGFEIFDVNSLEQLCINYANERLQQHYVAHFLNHLQAEYAEECIPWSPVQCIDNQPCLDILDDRASVFSLLNEEVYLNRKSNDVALRDRILDLRSEGQDQLRPSRPSMASAPGFLVQHYAGGVTYTVAGLVDKNRDDVPSDLTSLLSVSSNCFVQELFQDSLCRQSPGKKKKTVLTKFKSSLDELMSSLAASDVHYIRCLKPNEQNTPGVFQLPYVLQQLRACGTTQTVAICRQGYPARMLYHDFQQRYSCILRQRDSPRLQNKADSSEDETQKESVCDSLDSLLYEQLDMLRTPKRTSTPRKKLRRRTGLTQNDHARKVCASVLQTVFGNQGTSMLCQQFGRTKLFLREQQLERLEQARTAVHNVTAQTIQKAWRASRCRHHFRRWLAAARISRAWRAFRTRAQYQRVRRATITVQRNVRQWLHHRRLEEQRLEEQRLEEQRLEEQRLEEQRLAEQDLEEQRLAEHDLEEQRLAEQRLEEQRLAEQDLEEQRLVEPRLEEQTPPEERMEEQRIEEQKSEEQRLAKQHKEEEGRFIGLREYPGEQGSVLVEFCECDDAPAVSTRSVHSDSSAGTSPFDLEAPITLTSISMVSESTGRTPELEPPITLTANGVASDGTRMSPSHLEPPVALTAVHVESGSPPRPPSDFEPSVAPAAVNKMMSDLSKFDLKSSAAMVLPAGDSASVDTVLLCEQDNFGTVRADLDLSGNLSDDSGVIVHEPVPLAKVKGRALLGRGRGLEALEPPQKRQRLLLMAAEFPQLRDVQVGDGVITHRRIPKYGSRFHTRPSVLKYSHNTNRRDLPTGLPDILPPSEGTPIDP